MAQGKAPFLARWATLETADEVKGETKITRAAPETSDEMTGVAWTTITKVRGETSDESMRVPGH